MSRFTFRTALISVAALLALALACSSGCGDDESDALAALNTPTQAVQDFLDGLAKNNLPAALAVCAEGSRAKIEADLKNWPAVGAAMLEQIPSIQAGERGVYARKVRDTLAKLPVIAAGVVSAEKSIGPAKHHVVGSVKLASVYGIAEFCQQQADDGLQLGAARLAYEMVFWLFAVELISGKWQITDAPVSTLAQPRSSPGYLAHRFWQLLMAKRFDKELLDLFAEDLRPEIAGVLAHWNRLNADYLDTKIIPQIKPDTDIGKPSLERAVNFSKYLREEPNATIVSAYNIHKSELDPQSGQLKVHCVVSMPSWTDKMFDPATGEFSFAIKTPSGYTPRTFEFNLLVRLASDGQWHIIFNPFIRLILDEKKR